MTGLNEDGAESRPRMVSVRVVEISELVTAAAVLDEPGALIVDATGFVLLPLPLLARLARLRRAACAAGGELVLVASASVEQLLERTGLLSAVPCYQTLPDALASLHENAASS